MNLGNAFNVTVFAYGLLSIVAAIAGATQQGLQGQLVLFVISGATLVAAPFVSHQLPMVVVGLVGLHIAAIWQGLAQDDFHWHHHVIRLIASLIILGLYFRSHR